MKFIDEFKQFQSKYASSLQFKEMFPVYGEFSPQDNDEVISDEKRLLNEVLQQNTYGFTSSEYKLNQLQEGGKYFIVCPALVPNI